MSCLIGGNPHLYEKTKQSSKFITTRPLQLAPVSQLLKCGGTGTVRACTVRYNRKIHFSILTFPFYLFTTTNILQDTLVLNLTVYTPANKNPQQLAPAVRSRKHPAQERKQLLLWTRCQKRLRKAALCSLILICLKVIQVQRPRQGTRTRRTTTRVKRHRPPRS